MAPRTNSLGCWRLLRRFWQMRICCFGVGVGVGGGGGGGGEREEVEKRGEVERGKKKKSAPRLLALFVSLFPKFCYLLTISGRSFPEASVFSIVSCSFVGGEKGENREV